jgi:hypothetical protein
MGINCDELLQGCTAGIRNIYDTLPAQFQILFKSIAVKIINPTVELDHTTQNVIGLVCLWTITVWRRRSVPLVRKILPLVKDQIR